MHCTISNRTESDERSDVPAGVNGKKVASRSASRIGNLVTRGAIALLAVAALGCSAMAMAEANLEAMFSDAPGLEIEGYEIPCEDEWDLDEALNIENNGAEQAISSEAFEDAVEETEIDLDDEDGEAEFVENGARELELEDDGLEIETEEVAPEVVYSIEKIAPVVGRGYNVVVRYSSDSGIPEDAILTASEVADSYGDYLDSAERALGTGGESVQEFFLLDISLISGGVNYASTYRYEVEIVMNDTVGDVQAMQFDGGNTTLLNTVEADANSISFRPAVA